MESTDGTVLCAVMISSIEKCRLKNICVLNVQKMTFAQTAEKYAKTVVMKQGTGVRTVESVLAVQMRSAMDVVNVMTAPLSVKAVEVSAQSVQTGSVEVVTFVRIV